MMISVLLLSASVAVLAFITGEYEVGVYALLLHALTYLLAKR